MASRCRLRVGRCDRRARDVAVRGRPGHGLRVRRRGAGRANGRGDHLLGSSRGTARARRTACRARRSASASSASWLVGAGFDTCELGIADAAGELTLDGERCLGAADAFAVPSGRPFTWSDASPDLELLQTARPATPPSSGSSAPDASRGGEVVGGEGFAARTWAWCTHDRACGRRRAVDNHARVVTNACHRVVVAHSP